MAKEYLKGLDQVLSNLQKEMDKIPGKTLNGLIRAGIIVRRDMDKTPPLIPVDKGNLRSSFFLITHEGKVMEGENVPLPVMDVKGPYIYLGFSANYAVYVHENITANFQRPNAGAKFLESAIDRNHQVILYTIAKEAKI